jgi:hypothetical protein
MVPPFRMSELAPAPAPGTLIAGEFRVQSVIARSEVMTLEAERVATGARVRLELRSVADAVARRRAERAQRVALATARVADERLVACVGAGVDARLNAAWIAFEAAPGEPLPAVLAARGPFTARETVALVTEVAEVLEAARRSGVTHPSLGAASVLLEPSRRAGAAYGVKVTGFRGSAAADEDSVTARLDGLRAPSSRPPSDRGVAGDIAAVAQLAREMLAPEAVPPRSASPHDAAWYERPLEAALPAGFEAWFTRAIAADGVEGFATLREALEALDRGIVAHGPTSSRPPVSAPEEPLPLVSSAPPLAPWSAPPAPTGFSTAPLPVRGMPPWWDLAWRALLALTLLLIVAGAVVILSSRV